MNADNDKYWIERWKGIAMCEKADSDRLRRGLEEIKRHCQQVLSPLSVYPDNPKKDISLACPKCGSDSTCSEMLKGPGDPWSHTCLNCGNTWE